MNEERLVDLESRIAFQEHSLQQLRDEMAAQQKQMYDLGELCGLLLKKINNIGVSDGVSGGVEKPPHY